MSEQDESLHWTMRGLCANENPDDFFLQGSDQQRVKAFCEPCPVRLQCLADALENRTDFGVWGGMTERERRRLLRQMPQVKKWLPVLEKAEANEKEVSDAEKAMKKREQNRMWRRHA